LTEFTNLGLATPILKALAQEGYTTPTPIQAKAIPPILVGRDLIGIAQTGTGKTAAFALPMLHRLAAERRDAGATGCRALVLSPTRELASQIAESFRSYGRHLGLSVAVAFGGVSIGAQVRALARGVDILVATPGRLLDLVGQRKARLDQVEIFVLDEADRMLDMGFIRDIRRLVRALPAKRQSLFFSATMPAEIGRLAQELLREPERVAVTPEATTVERVDQRVMFVETSEKRRVLVALLGEPGFGRTLVFTRTKRGADRVVRHLAGAGIDAAAIHGNKSQGQRERALAGFRNGRPRVLVATDIASRGIDVDEVTHVVNYDVPADPESYVHRIGRTARAGAGGTALSFCDASERAYLKDIERLTRVSLAVAGHRHAEAERTETAAKGWRPERSRPSPAAKRQERSSAAPSSNRSWRSNGRRANALPAARGALTRPRSARLSLSGEPR
jgi:ATP-dependent RNA helicase RhlE